MGSPFAQVNNDYQAYMTMGRTWKERTEYEEEEERVRRIELKTSGLGLAEAGQVTTARLVHYFRGGGRALCIAVVQQAGFSPAVFLPTWRRHMQTDLAVSFATFAPALSLNSQPFGSMSVCLCAGGVAEEVGTKFATKERRGRICTTHADGAHAAVDRNGEEVCLFLCTTPWLHAG